MDKTESIGSKALKRNPLLKPFEFLVGEWVTKGVHPLAPDQELTGRTSFSWHEEGAYIIMRNEVADPRFPDGVAILGSDDSGQRFSLLYFDERGVSRILEVTAGNQTVSWKHDDPEFSQRVTITKQGDRLVSEGLMSRNGGPWTDDLSQVFERLD